MIQTITAAAIDIAAVLFAYLGMLAIVYGAICALMHIIRRADDTGLIFARGILWGLDFKLASELLLLTSERRTGQFRLLIVLALLRLLLTVIVRLETGRRQKPEQEDASHMPGTGTGLEPSQTSSVENKSESISGL